MSQTFRRQYSDSDVINALNAVKNGISLRKAAAQFGVPQTTLCDKRKQKYCIGKGRPGPASKLGVELEQRLVTYLQHMALIGHEIARKDVPAIVKFLLDSVEDGQTGSDGRFANCNMPSIGWVCRFFTRFPELDAWMPANHGRQKSPLTESTIRQWFDKLAFFFRVQHGINVADFLSDSKCAQIFSIRENTLPLVVSKELRCSLIKGKKNTDQSSLSFEKQVTVLCCGGADGRLPKPFVVFPSDHSTPDQICSNPLDLDFVSTPEDLSAPDFFYQWLTSSFFPSVKGKVSSPIVLFVDCPSLLISLAVHEFCNQNAIILFCLPHHASHVMQPLEISVFNPLQKIWNNTLLAFVEENGKAGMSKAQFIIFFRIAWQKAQIKSQKIKIAFQATGLVPFNPDAVSYSQLTGERLLVPQKKFLLTSHDINSRKEKVGMGKMFQVFEDCLADHLKVLFEKRYSEDYDGMDNDSDRRILWQFYKRGKLLVEESSSILLKTQESCQKEYDETNNTVDSTIKTEEHSLSREVDRISDETNLMEKNKELESTSLIDHSALNSVLVTTSGRHSSLDGTTNTYASHFTAQTPVVDTYVSIGTQCPNANTLGTLVEPITERNSSKTASKHVRKSKNLDNIIDRHQSHVQKKWKQKEYFAYICKQAYKAQKFKKEFARLKTQEHCKVKEYLGLVGNKPTDVAKDVHLKLDRRKEEDLLREIHVLRNITKEMVETDDSSTCTEDEEVELLNN